MRTHRNVVWLAMVIAFVAVLVLVGMLNASGASEAVFLPIIGQWKTCYVPAGPYPTIQSALDDSNCKQIMLAASIYQERLTVSRDVTIMGRGTQQTVLDAEYQGGAVYIGSTGHVVLRDMAIVNGRGENAALYNEGSFVSLENVTIRDHVAVGELGRVIHNRGHLTLTQSFIEHNQVRDSYALMETFNPYGPSSLVLQSTTVVDNDMGGAFTLLNSLGTVHIVDTHFLDEDNHLVTYGDSFFQNSVVQGGLIRFQGAEDELVFTDTFLHSVQVMVGANQHPLFTRTVFTGTMDGPALTVGLNASTTVVDSLFSHNGRPEDDHGTVLVELGHLELVRTEVSYNPAGGVRVGAQATLLARDSLFGHNGRFAVFTNGGHSSLVNSTVINTHSCASVFSVFGYASTLMGTLELNTSTISENDCALTVHLGHNAESFVRQVTFKDNVGVGLLTEDAGRIVLVNSILSDFGAYACDSLVNLTSLGFNIATDDSCPLVGPGDQPYTNPLLGPLQDNGGPTWTHAILDSRSPAVDSGSQTYCAKTDQRGVPRPLDGNHDGMPVCDIGAFELE